LSAQSITDASDTQEHSWNLPGSLWKGLAGQLSDQDPGRRRRTGRVQGRGEAHLGLSGRCAPSPGGFRLHLPYPACSLNCRRLPQRGRGHMPPQPGWSQDYRALQLARDALCFAPAACPASRVKPNSHRPRSRPFQSLPGSYSCTGRLHLHPASGGQEMSTAGRLQVRF
jgi:hypothetical protein